MIRGFGGIEKANSISKEFVVRWNSELYKRVRMPLYRSQFFGWSVVKYHSEANRVLLKNFRLDVGQ